MLNICRRDRLAGALMYLLSMLDTIQKTVEGRRIVSKPG
jgi:hypothetical protein